MLRSLLIVITLGVLAGCTLSEYTRPPNNYENMIRNEIDGPIRPIMNGNGGLLRDHAADVDHLLEYDPVPTIHLGEACSSACLLYLALPVCMPSTGVLRFHGAREFTHSTEVDHEANYLFFYRYLPPVAYQWAEERGAWDRLEFTVMTAQTAYSLGLATECN